MEEEKDEEDNPEEDNEAFFKIDLTEVMSKLDLLHKRLLAIETQQPASLSIGDVAISGAFGLSQLKDMGVSILKDRAVRDYLDGGFQRKKIFKGVSYVGE